MNLDLVLSNLEAAKGWSEWHPLERLPSRRSMPETGIYRVRIVGSDTLAYIGQSGRLPKRLSDDLRAALRVLCPLEAPHTAAAALWVTRLESASHFEVSFLSTEGLQERERKGAEAAATLLYRLKTGSSPTHCFHRMPPGWTRSGKARGSEARFVGGTLCASSLPPVALDADEISPTWAGLPWSGWRPLNPWSGGAAPTPGVYRLADQREVLYIGEGGALDKRLRTHSRSARSSTAGLGMVLASRAPSTLRWSAVFEAWDDSQREEIEYDLIGAIVLARRAVPAGQWATTRVPA